MIRIFLLSLLFLGAAGTVSAEPLIMSAPEAANAVASNEMILIDIRSPGEWAETGVAQGAIALTMHNPDFPQQITAILNADHGKTIGLICATGGRTEYVVSFLSQNGFDDVVDVSEGMIGNDRGPGWIARGMPLISSDDARMAYQLLALQR
jgi:rhodanese-related sulfurtransferase